jgi:hypothetical protein
MGHRQQMTDKQRREWDSMQYKARIEARRGHSFAYWDDVKHEQMLNNGWQLYNFKGIGDLRNFKQKSHLL